MDKQKEIERRQQLLENISDEALERIGHDTRVYEYNHKYQKSLLKNLTITTKIQFDETIKHVQNILNAENLLKECIAQLKKISEESKTKLDILQSLVVKKDLENSKKIKVEIQILVSKAMRLNEQCATNIQGFCRYRTRKMEEFVYETESLLNGIKNFLVKVSRDIQELQDSEDEGQQAFSGIDDVEMADVQESSSNSSINSKKLKILAIRLNRLSKALVKVTKQGKGSLREKVIGGTYIPVLKKFIKKMEGLSQQSINLNVFSLIIKNMQLPFQKKQLDRTLKLLLASNPDDIALKKAIYHNGKLQNLLQRNYSYEDEFSDISDSESEMSDVEDNAVDEIEIMLQKGENIQRAKEGDKDFVGVDLSGQDLKGIDFSNANLTNANLNGTNLKDTIFSDANLTGAKLNGAFFENTNFSGADLTQADFTGFTEWKNVNLNGVKKAKGVKLPGIKLIGTNFADGADFTDAILTGVKFNKVSLNKAIFRNTDLRDSILLDPDLNFSQFINADLSGTQFAGMGVYGGRDSETIKAYKGIIGIEFIENTKLEGSCFYNLSFKRSVFSDVNFYNKKHMNNTKIKSVSFNECFLNNLNMRKICGSRISFTQTTLRDINFAGSFLEYLSFSDTGPIGKTLNFSNATISESTFTGKVLNNFEIRDDIGRTSGIEIRYRTGVSKDISEMGRALLERDKWKFAWKTLKFGILDLYVFKGNRHLFEKKIVPIVSGDIADYFGEQWLNYENINSYMEDCDFTDTKLLNCCFNNLKFKGTNNFIYIDSAEGSIFNNIMIQDKYEDDVAKSLEGKCLMSKQAKVNERIDYAYADYWKSQSSFGEKMNKISQALGIIQSVASLRAWFA